jgi:hypothetical protein
VKRLILLCSILACGPTTEEIMGLNVNFEGVYRGPNRHSQVPPGAAERAENLVSYNKGEASVTEGMETLSGTYTTSPERFSSGITYDGYVIERSSTGGLYRRDPGVSVTAITTGISPPSGVSRVPYTEAGQDLYMATDEGVKVMDGQAATPAISAIPSGLSLTTGATAGTLLSVGESVAYRYVLSRPDAEGIYRRGTPSGRVVHTASGNEDVNVNMKLPAGLVATDRIEVYRTGISASGDPGDIMYLVSQTDLDTADYATFDANDFIDDTPDELRGEPLYTNGTQGGILRQNERAPLAKVITGFDDYLLTMNVKGPERFTFRFVGLPTAGDVLTIDGVDYEADADFVIGSGGTVAENIATTALNLATTINSRAGISPAREIYAYYLSGPNDAPGILALEAIDIAKAAFTVEADANGDQYEPPLTTAQSSLATTEPSGVWVSKRGEHYAFPPLRSSNATYRFRVGTKGKDILAAAPLREAVIVFTNGDGIYKVQRVGNELWRADQINSTTQLLVPGSVAVVDNQVFALTTRGLVAVDTGGVTELDLPIKDAIANILALNSNVLAAYTFAVGDDARNRYTLYHPESNSDTTATHAWVYNGTTGTWTERTDDASGGFIDDSTGLLYLGSPTSNTLTRERTGTVSDIYKRPDNTAIPVRLEWTVMDEGDPGASKQFTELRLLTKDALTGNVTFNCTNDLGGTESTTAVATSEPFARAWVPDGCQWTSRLKVDIQRSVLSSAFTVVGMKTLLAGMEDGSFTR